MYMGLLIFVRNLLLAVCLFLVLGFLYYSSWKLHLLHWEDSSVETEASKRLSDQEFVCPSSVELRGHYQARKLNVFGIKKKKGKEWPILIQS